MINNNTQKEVPPEENHTSQTTSTTSSLSPKNKTIRIQIKASNIPTDVIIHTPLHTATDKKPLTVANLKDLIRSHPTLSSSTRGRYLRLIFSGRLLAPDDAALDTFRLKDKCVVHAVIAAAGVRGGNQAALSRPSSSSSSSSSSSNNRNRNSVESPPRGTGLGILSERRTAGHRANRNRRILRGVGVGEDGLVISRVRGQGESRSDDEDEHDNEDDELEAGRERMGFDRLRADGLSRSEISALRIYFARNIDRFIAQRHLAGIGDSTTDINADGTATTSTNVANNTNSNSNNDGDNEEDEDDDPDETARRQRLRMEDEWMERQGPHSEFRLNLPSATNTLMNGNTGTLRRRGLYGSYPGGGRGGVGTSGSIDPMYAGPLGNDRDFIVGCCLGFMMGFIMMLWVWIPTVKHRTKVGILTGICFHMIINIMNKDEASGAAAA